MTRWCVPLALALAAGCSGKRKAERQEGRYALGKPSDGWDKTSPGSADYAWHHPGVAGTIYSDSNCGKRFEDGELPSLAKHLTWGVARGEPVREEALTLDGRAALVRVSEGQLDGVGVRVGVMVTKKDECLYDVLYLAPPATFEQGWSDFMAVVTGFSTQGWLR